MAFVSTEREMPYSYLDKIATADVAFKARGKTREEMFVAAADATMNVMVEDLAAVSPRDKRRMDISHEGLDLLLLQFLQEVIYYKDAEGLLLRVPAVQISEEGKSFNLQAVAAGEKIDPRKHKFKVDVKAVTLHRLKVIKGRCGWEATVVLDT